MENPPLHGIHLFKAWGKVAKVTKVTKVAEGKVAVHNSYSTAF